MKRNIIIICFLLAVFCDMRAVNVVPLPYYVRQTNGYFLLEKETDYIKELIDSESPQIDAFYIGLTNQNGDIETLCKKNGFYSQDFGDQGYELLIDRDKVILTANSPQGLFYGKQTLIQLIRSSKNHKLEGLHIIDKPAFKYRGIMDDISRGPVPTKEYMKYQIRRLAELKLNMLCYYTEHIVKTKKHPEFAPPAGGISIEEWSELCEYAKNYYVELVPNFQSLGHAEKVLQSPKYWHLRESDNMYALTNPETILFMKDIYEEMCPVFSSSYFHVNCDETFDIGKGPSKRLVDSLGVSCVYSDYMNQLRDILRNNGKRMMMWGDIALQHPDMIPLLPHDAIIMTWEYGNNGSFAQWIDPFVKNKFDFMVCPGILNSLRLFPDYVQALPNIRNFIREGAQKGALGVLTTVWDEGGLHSFDQDWYGVAYSADQAWNPNNQTIETFDERLATSVYQSTGKELFNAIHKCMELSQLKVVDKMSEVSFWKTIIPQRGKYSAYNLSGWQEVYKLCCEIDSFLQYKTAQNYVREYDAIQLVSDEYKYLSLAKLKLAEASSMYAEACCIQFENREKTIILLDHVKSHIMRCRDNLSKVKNGYCKIWNNENRAYWLNFEMDPFNQLLRDYDDLIQSFNQSVSFFLNGLPLLSPADIRLDIRELQGSYFTYWLISPAFYLEKGQDIHHDFLKEMGGEKEASPFPGFSFFDAKGANIKWLKYFSPLSDRVSFNDALISTDDAIAYAFCTIESPDERIVIASLGVGGEIEVFCNGEKVMYQPMNEPLFMDEFQCLLKLKPGKNRILLKIRKGIKQWDFSFQLKNVVIENSKHKYKIRSSVSS